MSIASATTSGIPARRLAASFAAVSMVFLVAGCASVPPPTLPSTQPRRGILPRSSKMKVAVFNFVDQTGSAGKLVETLPDMLSTELFGTKRFEVKERAELRSVDSVEMKAIQMEFKSQVDALVVGSITRFSVEEKTMTLDVRAYNAPNGTVMFAGHFDVHYSGVLDVKAERKDIAKIAEAIYAAFPALGDVNVRIAGVNGSVITINLGEKDGVKLGLGALVIARGDTLLDPVTKEELGDEVYVGEAYIIEVGPKSCKGLIVTPGAVVRLNDSIKFK